MNRTCYLAISIVPILPLVTTLSGCREVDPPLTNYADLGDAGQPLLPTVPAVRDSRVKAGQAEWKAFEAPDAKDTKGKKPGNKEDGAEEPAVPNDEIIADVQGLIDEYNAFVEEKKYDELVDFYVEGQRENATAVVNMVKDVDKILADLKAALLEKWPDGKERVEKLFQTLGKNSGAKLMVSDLKVISENEVDGKLPEIPMMPTTIKFRWIINEETKKYYWYIEDAMLAEFEKYKPMIEGQKAAMAGMLEQVKSGTVPAEPIVQQLEMSAKAMEILEAQGAKPKEADVAEAAPEKQPAEGGKKPDGGE